MPKNIDSRKNWAASARPSIAPLALLVSALLSVPVHAAVSDTVKPFISTTIAHDDNLLRQGDLAPGQEDDRADTSRRVDGGILFERPIGRQVISGQAKLTRVTFDRYRELDYSGKDLLAAWTWQLGNHLDGNLGTSYSETLAPYTDFHTEQRNLRVQRRQYVDGNWRFHPSWQTHAGFTREKYSYELLQQRYNNRTEDSSEFGVDYLARSGSRVGVVLRHLKGTYPEHRTFGDLIIDDGYDQDEIKANIFWLVSGTTQMQFVGGWERRQHPFYTWRDDSGTNGRLTVDYKPRGTVKWRLSAWREFAAVEGTLVSSSLNKGVSLGLAWDVTAKIRFDAKVQNQDRDFSAISGIGGTGDLSDSTRSGNVGVTYSLTPAIQFNLSAFHESRSGSRGLGTNSYDANGASFTASAQF